LSVQRAVKAPDPTELGWKDTVRMNPLEDIVVALRPIRPIDSLGITTTAGNPFEVVNRSLA